MWMILRLPKYLLSSPKMPRLCRVWNLMDVKLSYTACDLLLQLTRPPSFKDWTCIKQEPGTENIDMYPEKRSPNADQKSLVCYLTVMVLFQQLCRFGLCDVLFAQKSTPNSLCKCDTLAFVLSQLNLWHPPKNAGNILPRLCRVWNLMDAKLSCTACDLLLQLTRPPSFKDWTCIKQEPGTENIDMYPEKRSPNADQKSLVCYLTVMVLFQQLCRFGLCDVLFAQKSTPNSLCKCDTLAFVLSQLNLWHPPKNAGNILPRLCRVCNLMDAKLSYTACDLLLQLTRPPSFKDWTCIKQEPGTENIDMYPKKRSPNADQKSLVCYLTVMVLFQQLCRFRLCMSCLLRRALQSHSTWPLASNVGNILPRLCIVCSLVAAKHSYTVCDLLLKLTIGIGLASNKSQALKTLTCILKIGLQMRTNKA